MMEFSVLGPLSLRAGNLTITPTAPKTRQVLALLLMYANQMVSVSAIIRELWNDDPPRSALTTLQTYVLKLRRLFAAGLQLGPAQVSAEVLVTRVGGYLLKVDPGTLDMHRFERLARDGRAALATGDGDLAATRLRAALALWRDRALVDVQAGPLLSVQVARLEEARLAALEYRIEADLMLGLHRELLSELACLAAQHPLHENIHVQLMVALYRSGRRSDALDVYHRMRTRLVDELGLEPSANMRRMQQAILAADPALEIAPAPVTPPLDQQPSPLLVG
jgi:DNA-binding SARP family transcriptional activator